jgi:hypothetical protein
MSKRYSVFFKVFPSICGVTVSISATILSFSSSRESQGLVNNILNVSSQEEMKRNNIGWARRPRNWPSTPRKMHVKQFSDNTSLVWEWTTLLEHELGWQIQLQDIEVGHRCQSLFLKDKGPHKFRTWHSPLHYLFRFLEWREGFLIPIFCRYDDLHSLIRETSLQHWISISEGNFHQLRHLTKCLDKWETAGFIVRLWSLHNLQFVGMEAKVVMNNPRNSRLWYT